MSTMRCAILLILLSLSAPAFAATDASATARAAAKIDEVIVARLSAAGQKPNAALSDEVFVRRIYIDVAGRIPTAQELTAFMADASWDPLESTCRHASLSIL